MSQPDWMQQENDKAKDSKKLPNTDAPVLERVIKEPKRKQKAFYIQDGIAEAFEDFVLQEKRKSKRKAPVLIEEAIIDILEKYGYETKSIV